MSRISQDFINSVGYLYEEINVQKNDFLNEESEYYDQEAAELVEDILSTISSMMVCEGYSAEGIIGFLADSSDENIIEKYLSFDEIILTENTVSEDYIEEQLEIFDFAINEGLGSLLGKVAKGTLSLAGRIASKPARSKVAQKLATSKNPEKTRQAMQRLAQREARKGNVGGYTKTSSPIDGGKQMTGKQSAELLSKAKMSQATQKVKDIASKAKEALPKVGKAAGIFGLGAAGGFVGAKLAGAGSKPSESPKLPTPPSAPSLSTPAPTAPSRSLPSSGGGGGGASSGGGKSSKPSTSSKQTGDKAKDMASWEKANPRLAQAEKLRASGASREEINKVLYDKGTAASKGSGQSQMEKDAEELRKMANRSKQRQGELMGGPEGPGEINKKEVENAIKDTQERQKKKSEQEKSMTSTKESYEPYDILLDYLMSGGHADTIEEAHYIMLEMDASSVQSVVEEYENYLLAEEVSEWVNSLLEEGYDLSECSWDDIVEYYVTEAKYGTSEGRKELAKKVRAGKDVGKKGGGFEEIVKKASPKYGKERATKIAAAAMWKNLGK